MPQFSRRFSVLSQVAARDIAAEDAAAALSEDIGDGDISAGLVLANTRGTGLLYARESAVLCGREWFEECFLQLDKTAEFVWHAEEGGDVTPGMIVGETRAGFRALLGGERSALNFLQTLSATAGVAREMQQLAGDVLVVDTRKTLPKLRAAQKYAVRIGGAHNHRHGLFDEILIKENHAAAAGGITAAWQKARQITDEARIQVEVRTFAELKEALSAGVQRILLDNFSIIDLQDAVRQAGGRAELEASGDIHADNIAAVSATGVSRISIGALTKHVRAVDFSFILSGENDENDAIRAGVGV